jgi:hypothetical protein
MNFRIWSWQWVVRPYLPIAEYNYWSAIVAKVGGLVAIRASQGFTRTASLAGSYPRQPPPNELSCATTTHEAQFGNICDHTRGHQFFVMI